jgi:hypothetical protein
MRLSALALLCAAVLATPALAHGRHGGPPPDMPMPPPGADFVPEFVAGPDGPLDYAPPPPGAWGGGWDRGRGEWIGMCRDRGGSDCERWFDYYAGAYAHPGYG